MIYIFKIKWINHKQMLKIEAKAAESRAEGPILVTST